jgi:hypothetical protein
MAKSLAGAEYSVKLATPTQKINVELFTPMNWFAGKNPKERGPCESRPWI